MAPIDVLYKLKAYIGRKDKDLPVISARNAALLSILFTLLYVLPFYLSKATRPSPTLNRDAPSVIRARIQTVTLACVIASLSTYYLLVVTAKGTLLDGLRVLGWWPIGIWDIIRCSFLTFLLYLGPLFERIIIGRDLDDFRGGRAVVESLSSWMGYRNYVAGPVTEEVIFRSVIVSLHVLAKASPSRIVLLTPLYFGIAHVHHFYEFTLTHPHTPIAPAFLRSVFQFTYTTLFGWFVSFIYLRTGSLYSCIVIHIFCNWFGLPRFWGRAVGKEEPYTIRSPLSVRGKNDSDLGGERGVLHIGWTVAYYALLFIGAYAFYLTLWPLTESSHGLVTFGARAQKG